MPFSAGAVYGYCASGRLRHTRVVWAIRVARSDLEAFIEKGSAGGVATSASRLLLPAHGGGRLAPAQFDDGGPDGLGRQDGTIPGASRDGDDS